MIAALLLAGLLAAWSWRRPVRLIWSLWVVGLLHGVMLLVAGPGLLRVKELLLAALLARLVTDRRARGLARAVPVAPLVALGGVALLSLLFSSVPTVQALLGLRGLLQWPLLLLGACAYLDRREVERGLTLLLPVLALSTALAVWQYRSPVESLLSAGYSYFLNVREYAGVVRAFGGMIYSIPFGHSMAVLALAYLATAATADGRRLRLGSSAGAALALVGLLCSGNRTALVGFAVSALTGAAVLLRRLADRRLRQRLGVAAAALALLGVLVVTLDPRAAEAIARLANGGAALAARFDIWRVVVSEADPLLGDGPGTFGVSALPRGASAADQTRYFGAGIVDNYYVTLYGQYGLAAVPLVVGWLLVLRHRVARSTAALPDRLTALCCLVYLALAMLTLNIWEDFPQPVFLWSLVGAGLRDGLRAPPRVQDTATRLPSATPRVSSSIAADHARRS